MRALLSRKLWVSLFTLIGIFAPLKMGALEKIAGAVVAAGYAIGQGMVDAQDKEKIK